MKISETGIAGIIAGALVLIYLAPKLKAVAAAAAQYVSPDGQSPLANPVSEFFGRLFKSDAEKKVDAMLGAPIIPQPTKKAVVLPGSGYENSPATFGNPNQRAPGSGYENSPATFGASTRAAGSVAGPAWENFYGN